MIHIQLNGEPRPVEDGTSLAALVESLGQLPTALATAVNGDYVARPEREACRLRSGDAVMTFQPITGG